MNLPERLKRLIESWDRLRPGDRLVLGVSGGADSLCLLYCLHSLAPELGLLLEVAHLDHGLRPEAGAEAEFVRAQATALGLPFHLGRADTLAHAAKQRQSLEEAARAVRYGFLADVARGVGARHIAVAHTADDQAETVLMHFLRGSGLAGLKGMLAVTESGGGGPEAGDSDHHGPTPGLCLLRPLLTTTRAEVDAYCLARGLAPRHDESNTDTRFLRNRLRHELLPLLEQYNPRLRAVLARTATVLAGEHALAQAHLDRLWAALAPPERQPAGQVAWDRAGWLALAPAEQRALLRAGVQRLRRHLRDVDFTPIDAAARFSRGAAPGRGCDVAAGLRLSVLAKAVVLHPWGTVPAPAAHEGPQLNEANRLADGWRFAAEFVEPEEWAAGQPPPAAGTPWTVYVDAAAVRESLCVRARRRGDRFQPLGLGGHSTSVSDFMVNQKVPRAQRNHWPLVVSGETIVWVAGLRLDERYALRPDTRRALRLRFYRS